MGRVNLPCNLTDQEKKKAWGMFEGYLTPKECEEIIDRSNNYLFYETNRKGDSKYMHCSYADCGSFIQYKYEDPNLFRKKHGEITRCPHCGRVVKMMALGRMKSFSSINRQYSRITVCRAAPDGALLLMSGYSYRDFYEEDLRPYPIISWKTFTYLNPGKRMQWERRWCNADGIVDGPDFMEKKTVGEPFQPAMNFYDPGGDSYFINLGCIESTNLKYCQLDRWLDSQAMGYIDLEKDPARDVVKYLSAYTEYPNIEMAVKAELQDAVTELVRIGKKNAVDLNWRSKKLQDFLRLPKQECNAFMKSKPSMEVLRLFHKENKAGTIQHMRDLLEIVEVVGEPSNVEFFSECCTISGCTAKQGCNYMKKQPGGGKRVLQFWKDYLNMAETLRYDLGQKDVAMPKDLKERHDIAAEIIATKEQAENEKKFKKLNKRLHKMYDFAYGNLCIVAPDTPQEIVEEGKVLHHCVGGYAGRHFNGSTVILFIRHKRKPQTPFLTMEIVPRNRSKSEVSIVQVHGYKNEFYNRGDIGKRPENKYAWFLNMWKQWAESGSPRNKDGSPILPEDKEKIA